MDVKFLADTKMADSKRELELQKATFNQEVNTKVRINFPKLFTHLSVNTHACTVRNKAV